MITVRAESLSKLVSEIFAAAGCSELEATQIAHYLVRADLCGHGSHGVVRVPQYLQLLREGLVHPDKRITVLFETPSLAVVDGEFGFGQTVVPQAVNLGIAKCREHGVAAIALRNSGHLGRLGDWAELASSSRLISIHLGTVAGSALVAPFGASERRFSTAPFAIGVPMSDAPPLVLDFATSQVAEGKVLVASYGGPPVPDDALIGPDGVKSNEPQLLYGEFSPTGPRNKKQGAGAIRAFGEHKGSGLALMCELLGGALTGQGGARDGAHYANGVFSIYLDPDRFDVDELFAREVRDYIAHVKSARPIAPGSEVMVPGEPETRTLEERMRSGIPLTREIWSSISTAAHSASAAAVRILSACR